MNILKISTYRTCYFGHQFAVGCVTGLGQGGERARLACFLAGQFVFTLQRNFLNEKTNHFTIQRFI